MVFYKNGKGQKSCKINEGKDGGEIKAPPHVPNYSALRPKFLVHPQKGTLMHGIWSLIIEKFGEMIKKCVCVMCI